MTSVKASMSAGHKMVHDANLQDLATTLGCKMKNSTATMQTQLAAATVTHPRMLIGRQQTIVYLRQKQAELSAKWKARFTRMAEIEADVGVFFKKDAKDKDSLEEDAIAQLSFQQQALKPLNHIPFLLVCLSAFKIWMVPAASILLPLLVWILPYILLRFVYALPITQDQYMQIVQQIMSGNMNLPNFHDAPVVPPEPITLRAIFQYMMFSFTFVQSMVQPIQNAMHLYKTDSICLKLGKQILEIRKALQEFREDLGPVNGIHVKLSFSLEQLDASDARIAFISIQDYPENIHMVFRDLANLECMWCLATHQSLQMVTFSRGVLKLDNAVDISLGDAAIPSSLHLQEQPHAILTGPNGGGKSSFLRSVLQGVLIGHAFGFAPAEEAYMPRFTWIASGLQLRDSPGKLSMFETEVKFAADCIFTARRGGPGLVIFDELFHSTNPPDSVRTATQFLQRLWKQNDVFTVVSTHIFPLVAAAPKNVQALCCPATQDEDGTIHYSYGVKAGVCTISSVHTVWDKFGLVPARLTGHRQSLNEKENNAK
jgi:hypothetical protein